VEEGAEAEDGGKALIREMPPFEADRVVGDLARKWVEERLEMLGEMVTRSIEREVVFFTFLLNWCILICVLFLQRLPYFYTSVLFFLASIRDGSLIP
jgi:hypothetical protein